MQTKEFPNYTQVKSRLPQWFWQTLRIVTLLLTFILILANGTALPADLLLFCVGIRAQTSLAESLALDINRGVLVDAQMQTSDNDIYCVGDAAELPGTASGLWSVANEQGKIAAAALLGLDTAMATNHETKTMPAVQLKVGGIDLKCFGSLDENEDIKSYTGGDVDQHQWKHLLLKDGKITAGVFVNAPLMANAVISALKQTDKKLSDEEIKDFMSRDSG